MSSLDLKLLQDVSDKYITGFTPTIAAVEIDGQRITDFELMEDGATIKFRMPPHTDGHVGVKLILRNGTSQVVASGFTYIAMPLAIINEIANPSTGDSILRVFALFSFAIFAFIVMVKLMRLMSIR